MADLYTVAISVGSTLTIQGIYYIAMRFPYQLHKDKASLRRLVDIANAKRSISVRIGQGLKEADAPFETWREHLQIVQNKREGDLIDRNYFRDIIPSLASSLGRLKGLGTTQDSSGLNEVLSDLIWLYEKALRLSKSIASFEALSDSVLLSESSDIAMIDAKIKARFEQTADETQVEYANFSKEIEDLFADVRDTYRRFTATAIFVSLFIGTAGAVISNAVDDHLKLHGPIHALTMATGIFLPALLMVTFVHFSIKFANKNVVHLKDCLAEESKDA